MGNYVNVKLQLYLILRKVLIAAGEIMICLLTEQQEEAAKGNKEKGARVLQRSMPPFLVKLKQPKTRGIFSSQLQQCASGRTLLK